VTAIGGVHSALPHLIHGEVLATPPGQVQSFAVRPAHLASAAGDSPSAASLKYLFASFSSYRVPLPLARHSAKLYSAAAAPWSAAIVRCLGASTPFRLVSRPFAKLTPSFNWPPGLLQSAVILKCLQAPDSALLIPHPPYNRSLC
jgi:hypothetical protein